MNNNHEKNNLNNNFQDIYIHQLIHESDMARMAKTNELLMKANKRQNIQNIAQLILILGMIICFFIYESQYDNSYEEVSQNVKQDTDTGNNNFIGGDYNNGTTGSENENN